MILMLQIDKIIYVLRLQPNPFHRSTFAIYKRNEFPPSLGRGLIFSYLLLDCGLPQIVKL